ncbi:PREDICTED: atherin-like, partial [Chinchilla lanigera]|uniref:atherin-like n=1 Tax=Chinchilla lanigera TaxID=34839 RepID=UPI000696207F
MLPRPRSSPSSAVPDPSSPGSTRTASEYAGGRGAEHSACGPRALRQPGSLPATTPASRARVELRSPSGARRAPSPALPEATKPARARRRPQDPFARCLRAPQPRTRDGRAGTRSGPAPSRELA